MNKDFRISVSWFTHPKRLLLRSKVGDPGEIALFQLWALTATHYPKGEWPLASNQVEDIVGWRGENGKLVSSLLESKLIEAVNGSFRIHNWDKWNKYAYYSKERSEKALEAISCRWKNTKSNTERNTFSNTECNTERNTTGYLESDTFSNTPSPSPIPTPIPTPNVLLPPIFPLQGGQTEKQILVVTDPVCTPKRKMKPKIQKPYYDPAERTIVGLTKEDHAHYTELFPNIDLDDEVFKLCEWIHDHPDRYDKNIRLTMRNWFAKASERRSLYGR